MHVKTVKLLVHSKYVASDSSIIVLEFVEVVEQISGFWFSVSVIIILIQMQNVGFTDDEADIDCVLIGRSRVELSKWLLRGVKQFLSSSSLLITPQD